MNADVFPRITTLPPLLDFRTLQTHFQIGRTVAYQLASAGEIQTLTLGAPGKRGKRVFLTESVLAFLDRRTSDSAPLNCFRERDRSSRKIAG